MEAGGVQSMAKLLNDENVSSIMRYDASVGSWRMYNPATGIWHLPKENEDVTLVSSFLRSLLKPIVYLAEFVGPTKFDWVGGVHEPDPENGDADGNYGDKDGPPTKRKRLCKSSFVGEYSLQKLKNAITMFVELPKHTAEVIRQLIFTLHAPFAESCKSNRLACPNGVVNLETGELLPIAKPSDFFTTACVTIYDPNACPTPAMEYIQAYFPPEAYEDHAGLVRCLQQWLGYCLTGETRIEKTMWLYGEGSNGKSQLIDMLAHVLGKDIHAQIPMASLCKVRGVNNDALYDARQARHVTISESDSTTKISEAAFHSIVSGEVQSLKTMWKKEVSCKSNMKMTFAVNTLPTWDNPTDLCSTRRNIYVPLKKIYIDPNDAPSMKLANEYRAKGLPECLIAPKNLKHFNTKVCGHETSFLRFMVLGSKAYYKQGHIEIPPSLNAHQCVENLDKGEAVENYVSEHLRIVSGEKLLMRDILVHFRANSKIEAISVKDADFAPLLWAATLNKGAEWTDGVQYHNNKMKDGRRGMAYMNVAFVHLETGIRSFTEITPRHPPILDKEAAVQRDNVVFWKTNGKINNDLQWLPCKTMFHKTCVCWMVKKHACVIFLRIFEPQRR